MWMLTDFNFPKQESTRLFFFKQKITAIFPCAAQEILIAYQFFKINLFIYLF